MLLLFARVVLLCATWGAIESAAVSGVHFVFCGQFQWPPLILTFGILSLANTLFALLWLYGNDLLSRWLPLPKSVSQKIYPNESRYREHSLHGFLTQSQDLVDPRLNLGRLSHELNTSLNAILGAAQVLSASDAESDMVSIIIYTGKVMANLVSDFLLLSQCQTGDLRLSFRPLSIADVLQSVHRMFLPEAERIGVKLDLSVDEGLPGTFYGDRTRIKQVLVSLLCNAFKAVRRMPRDKRIVISAEPNVGAMTPLNKRHQLSAHHNHHAVKFVLEDNGCGIRKEDQSELFLPFHRAVATTPAGSSGSDLAPGCGLGLCLCKRLVNLMGGRIELQSEAGQGTRVEFIIPSRMPDITAPTETPSVSVSSVMLKSESAAMFDDIRPRIYRSPTSQHMPAPKPPSPVSQKSASTEGTRFLLMGSNNHQHEPHPLGSRQLSATPSGASGGLPVDISLSTSSCRLLASLGSPPGQPLPDPSAATALLSPLAPISPAVFMTAPSGTYLTARSVDTIPEEAMPPTSRRSTEGGILVEALRSAAFSHIMQNSLLGDPRKHPTTPPLPERTMPLTPTALNYASIEPSITDHNLTHEHAVPLPIPPLLVPPRALLHSSSHLVVGQPTSPLQPAFQTIDNLASIRRSADANDSPAQTPTTRSPHAHPTDPADAVLNSISPTSPTKATLPLHFIIIDDNPINRKVLMRMLSALCAEAQTPTTATAEISCCCECREAIALIHAGYEKFRIVVLTDIHMPEMSGLELTSFLREKWSELQLPIIGVTADHTLALRDQCLRVGMQAVLMKPILRAVLKETLDAVIRSTWASPNVVAEADLPPPLLSALVPGFDSVNME